MSRFGWKGGREGDLVKLVRKKLRNKETKTQIMVEISLKIKIIGGAAISQSMRNKLLKQ